MPRYTVAVPPRPTNASNRYRASKTLPDPIPDAGMPDTSGGVDRGDSVLDGTGLMVASRRPPPMAAAGRRVNLRFDPQRAELPTLSSSIREQPALQQAAATRFDRPQQSGTCSNGGQR